MKILKTVKGKLLVRILLVVVIGIAVIGILGSYLNFHSTRATHALGACSSDERTPAEPLVPLCCDCQGNRYGSAYGR